MRTTAWTRREFLTQLAACGVVLPRVPLAPQDRLPTRVIPVSGERIPVIALGSTKAVLELPDEGPASLTRVLHLLLEYGGRVVDTAPRPEAIDAIFGQLLQDLDLVDRLFLAVKINAEGREAGIGQFRQTQRLFGRERFDLVQIESLSDLDTHWPTLQGWKDAGEARYIGVTVSSDRLHDRLEAFMRRETLDFVHLNYSVVETRVEDRILPLAQDRGIAVMTNRPFMNGSYFQRTSGRPLPAWAAEFDCTSWAQFSLKYIQSHPAITVVNTETTDPEHMEENIRTAFGRMPDQAMRRRMRALFD